MLVNYFMIGQDIDMTYLLTAIPYKPIYVERDEGYSRKQTCALN